MWMGFLHVQLLIVMRWGLGRLGWEAGVGFTWDARWDTDICGVSCEALPFCLVLAWWVGAAGLLASYVELQMHRAPGTQVGWGHTAP